MTVSCIFVIYGLDFATMFKIFLFVSFTQCRKMFHIKKFCSLRVVAGSPDWSPPWICLRYIRGLNLSLQRIVYHHSFNTCDFEAISGRFIVSGSDYFFAQIRPSRNVTFFISQFLSTTFYNGRRLSKGCNFNPPPHLVGNTFPAKLLNCKLVGLLAFFATKYFHLCFTHIICQSLFPELGSQCFNNLAPPLVAPDSQSTRGINGTTGQAWARLRFSVFQLN